MLRPAQTNIPLYIFGAAGLAVGGVWATRYYYENYSDELIVNKMTVSEMIDGPTPYSSDDTIGLEGLLMWDSFVSHEVESGKYLMSFILTDLRNQVQVVLMDAPPEQMTEGAMCTISGHLITPPSEWYDRFPELDSFGYPKRKPQSILPEDVQGLSKEEISELYDTLQPMGSFLATKIQAKHDNNVLPIDVADEVEEFAQKTQQATLAESKQAKIDQWISNQQEESYSYRAPTGIIGSSKSDSIPFSAPSTLQS